MFCSVLEKMRKLDTRRTKDKISGLKWYSTAEEQYLKVISLGNRKKSSKELTQDLRDAFGPSVDPSTVH